MLWKYFNEVGLCGMYELWPQKGNRLNMRRLELLLPLGTAHHNLIK